MKRLVFALLLLSSTAYAKTSAIVGVALDQSSIIAPSSQTLTTPSGETGTISITVTHPDGTAYNLTGAQLLLAVGSKISRQATIDNAAAGTAHFPLVIADTLSMLGTYSYDVSLTASDGSFYRVVPASSFVVTSGIGQPGQAVTVPASQVPLALGPAGAPGPTSIGHIESGTAAITAGSGAGHDWIDVTFNSAFTAATGASGYTVDAQISLTTNTDPTVGWSITNKTTTGMRVQFSSTFAGEVRWKAYDVASSTSVLPNPAPSILAGTGLTGGGALTSNQTLSIAATVPNCTPTTAGDYCGWSGTTWVREPAPAGGGGGGTVTSIVIGTGLASTQSPLTTTGTLSIASTVPICTPTTSGDYCGWNGTAWVREPAPAAGGTQGGSTTAAHVPYASSANTLADSAVSYNAAGAYGPTLSIPAPDASHGIAIKADVTGNGGTWFVRQNSFGYDINGSIYYYGDTAAWRPNVDSTVTNGSTSARWLASFVGGPAASQPACNASNRGAMMNVFAALGAPDSFQICMKATADTYAWRTVFTSP